MAVSTLDWIDFFEKAGIPSNEAASYALIFTQNRIQKNMLPDLNKEYLKDMGISLLGDVIAILKHAKHVHEKNIRVGLLESNGSAPEADEPGGSTTKQLMDFYSQKYKEAEECLKVVMKSTPANPPVKSPSKIKKIVLKKEMAEGTSKIIKAKNLTIFKRLEEDSSPKIETVTSKKTYSVFSRLGNLSSLPLDEDKSHKVLEKTAEESALVIQPNKSDARSKDKGYLNTKSLRLLKITTQFSDDEEVADDATTEKPAESIPSNAVRVATPQKRPIRHELNDEATKGPLSKKVRFGSTSTKVIDYSNKSTKQPVFQKHTIVPITAQPRKAQGSGREKNRSTLRSREPRLKPVSKMVADTIKPRVPASVKGRIGQKVTKTRRNNILDRLG